MTARCSRSALFADIHDPRLADLVRSGTAGAAAVVSPIVSTPLVGSIASTHRTPRTVGYSSRAITSDTDIPANEGFGRVGRFTF